MQHRVMQSLQSTTHITPPPLVSVIVPLFKTEAYVEKCIASIQAQTLSDIEILCVDDCSPDRSADIVERLSLDDRRIRLIRHAENLGLGGARNTGIRAARATYIASVDSDDYIAPNMLQALYEATNNGHFDVVVCGYDRVDEAGTVLTTHMRKVGVLDPIPASEDIYKLSNPAFWNKLWRRGLYVDNDIYFPNHIYYQDAATTPRIYTCAKSIKYIGGNYYKYLVRQDSVTNQRGDKHLLDKFRELDTVKDFLIARGLYHSYKKQFEKRVRATFKYHAETLTAGQEALTEDARTYLRHMLMMREAYLTLDDSIRTLPETGLSKAFENDGFSAPPTTTSSGPPKFTRPWSKEPNVVK